MSAFVLRLVNVILIYAQKIKVIIEVAEYFEKHFRELYECNQLIMIQLFHKVKNEYIV